MRVRDVNYYEILSRRQNVGFAAADDFALRWRGASPVLRLSERMLPYCADLARERMLFTFHDQDGFTRIRNEPFMFNEQLATAQSVMSLPFERLDEVSAKVAAPVLVFSLGRTGSTLLVKLMEAAGRICASEPDMLTQITRAEDEEYFLLAPNTRENLARACLVGLCNTLGGALVIKLRSQCNTRPLLLAQALPGCRVVFMVRGARAWALSRHRTFGEPPEMIANVLRQSIDAIDKLMFAGMEFRILWFEAMVADPAGAMEFCLDDTIEDRTALDAVMLRDSQEGTSFARVFSAAAPVQVDFWEVFEKSWAEARVGAEWHSQTEALLGEMFAAGG